VTILVGSKNGEAKVPAESDVEEPMKSVEDKRSAKRDAKASVHVQKSLQVKKLVMRDMGAKGLAKDGGSVKRKLEEVMSKESAKMDAGVIVQHGPMQAKVSPKGVTPSKMSQEIKQPVVSKMDAKVTRSLSMVVQDVPRPTKASPKVVTPTKMNHKTK